MANSVKEMFDVEFVPTAEVAELFHTTPLHCRLGSLLTKDAEG